MRNTADSEPVSPLYRYLDRHVRSVKVRVIKLRIERGIYDERAAIPRIVDRIMKELDDGNE